MNTADPHKEVLRFLRKGIHRRLVVGYGQASGKMVVLPRVISQKDLPAQTKLLAKVQDLLGDGLHVKKEKQQGFGFLGSPLPLRAGARIRRGDIGGDSGTLGLPLEDAQGQKYFLAAGHIVSSYWSALTGVVERYVANNQTRLLGEVKDCWSVKPTTASGSGSDQLDVGIIEAASAIETIGTTTCGFSVGPEDNSIKPNEESSTVERHITSKIKFS